MYRNFVQTKNNLINYFLHNTKLTLRREILHAHLSRTPVKGSGAIRHEKLK